MYIYNIYHIYTIFIIYIYTYIILYIHILFILCIILFCYFCIYTVCYSALRFLYNGLVTSGQTLPDNFQKPPKYQADPSRTRCSNWSTTWAQRGHDWWLSDPYPLCTGTSIFDCLFANWCGHADVQPCAEPWISWSAWIPTDHVADVCWSLPN